MAETAAPPRRAFAMCLIVHKPSGLRIPHELLEAALTLNPDGWGVMGFEHDGRLLLDRGTHIDAAALRDFESRHIEAEYALHLRKQTRGSSGLENTHPFRIVEGLYLMHNGTLPIEARLPGRSDTWHFTAEVLRPLAQRHPGLLSDYAFVRLLELGLRPENKLALLDERLRRIVLINRGHGAEFEGLWLSNTRWIDRARFPLALTPQPQERSWTPEELEFL